MPSSAPSKDSLRGWSVVGATFMGLLISYGTLVIYSFGVLNSAMAAEFHWTSVDRGTLFASLSLSAALGGPLWGVFADRCGGRLAVLCSSGLLALGFWVLAALPGDLVIMHIAFAILGLLGSGTMPPTFASVLVGWFDRHRGLALGVSMMSVGLGAAVLPPVSAALTATFGWRMTYVVFGAAMVILVIPTVLLFLRVYPETRSASGHGAPAPLAVIRSSFRQRKTWILAVFAFLTGAVLITSVSTFVPMLQARGETIAAAARYQSILGISLIAGRIIIGGLIDRVFAPYVMMAVLLATSAGFFTLYAADTPVAYMVAAAGIGLAIGAEVDFLGYMISRYFGRSSFATIFAIMFAIYALGGSFTPPLFGWLAQQTGSYAAGLFTFAALILALAVSMFALPSYANGHSTSGGEG